MFWGFIQLVLRIRQAGKIRDLDSGVGWEGAKWSHLQKVKKDRGTPRELGHVITHLINQTLLGEFLYPQSTDLGTGDCIAGIGKLLPAWGPFLHSLWARDEFCIFKGCWKKKRICVWGKTRLFPPMSLLYSHTTPAFTTILTLDVRVFPPSRNPVTPAGCPTIQLNFDTAYLKIASDSTG